jgi:hypothetical protein
MYKNQPIYKKRFSDKGDCWTARTLVCISLCFYPLSSTLAEVSGERFIKLDSHGTGRHSTGHSTGDSTEISATANHTEANWNCVLDSETGLVWEIKTLKGLRSRDNFYTWYNPNPKTDGGAPGYRNGGKCSGSSCDTHSYEQAINKLALCGFHNWRLPSREELRSLVDYTIKPPQPMIDSRYFPHAAEQFYWSATADADDANSAWGVGFAFGYDYSYLKYGFGYVRLVTEYKS